MTTTQKNLITPATGLVVYDTTLNVLQFYNGSAWTNTGGGNTIYSADDTIGSGRVATLTDTLEFRSGSIGVGTTSIDSSSVFEIDSTTQGFLPPRMTNAQMLAIGGGGSPATGLIVYDLSNQQWMGYNGTSWVILG